MRFKGGIRPSVGDRGPITGKEVADRPICAKSVKYGQGNFGPFPSHAPPAVPMSKSTPGYTASAVLGELDLNTHVAVQQCRSER